MCVDADAAMLEGMRLATRALEHVPGGRCEGEVAGRRLLALALARGANEVGAHIVERDLGDSEEAGREPVLLAQQGEQEVLGADPGVVEGARLVGRPQEHVSGPLREARSGGSSTSGSGAGPESLWTTGLRIASASAPKSSRMRAATPSSSARPEQDVLCADVVVANRARSAPTMPTASSARSRVATSTAWRRHGVDEWPDLQRLSNAIFVVASADDVDDAAGARTRSIMCRGTPSTRAASSLSSSPHESEQDVLGADVVVTEHRGASSWAGRRHWRALSVQPAPNSPAVSTLPEPRSPQLNA